MKVLVLGANGATGFNLVTQLLKQRVEVRAFTRSIDKFHSLSADKHLEVIQTSVLELDNQKLEQYLFDVDAVVSCLGHNISMKGIFGKPRTLVVDSLRKIVQTIENSTTNRKIKIILMNTTACINKSQFERYGAMEYVVMSLLKLLLPPHRDNVSALDFLLNTVSTNSKIIEWIAVRPDGLINTDEVSEYSIHPSTMRSPIFNAGKTSRINVAHFMVRLLKDKNLWEMFKYKTPVIYNVD